MKPVLKDKKLSLALNRGFKYFFSLQNKNGSWSGDYGGPMFLISMYVASTYICQKSLDKYQIKRITQYYFNVQNDNGSFGLHAEAKEGSMFSSVLAYIALRILGAPKSDKRMKKLTKWILTEGTATSCASWGKYLLCLLNLYKYEGIHPVIPELYRLPIIFPFHPRRLWCHSRQVYLPIAYLYGNRCQIKETKLIIDIRKEIYNQPYDEINFSQHRDTISLSDAIYKPPIISKLANKILDIYEVWHLKSWREKGNQTVYEHLKHEDEATHFIRIGPVNAIFNTLVHYFTDKRSESYKKSWETLPTYLFDGHDGMKMNGYNSSALWDTAFGMQAILASLKGVTNQNKIKKTSLRRAYEYLKNNQIIKNERDYRLYHRHASLGGWPFSDRAHGWPVTDCTAEGFKCAVAMEDQVKNVIPPDLLRESIKLILSFQNKDGGWSSYERKRGGDFLEWFNPSNVFYNIMVDYSYVECSSACLQTLILAKKRFPGEFEKLIDKAIKRGVKFIKSRQKKNGSWEGSWAVCFTYGTWFGVWGLIAAGLPMEDPIIQKACEFLMDHQNEDGGWGEHYQSCLKGHYVAHPQSQVVNTAWALLTLIKAGKTKTKACQRGIDFLLNQQTKTGDWPRESLVGVFNKTTLINYENYRRYFCLWALGLYKMANDEK